MKTIPQILIGLFFILGSFNAFSMDIDQALKDAKSLYQRRGESPDFAKQAADAYEVILGQVDQSDVLLMASLHTKISEALYYVGDKAKKKQDKIDFHWAAASKAKDAFGLLHESRGVPKKEEFARPLANLYYWYGANMGRWGEANGIMQSLKEWPKVREYMESIIEMGQAEAVAYGANRILGRAYFKLPFPLGSKTKSLKYLKEAVEKTAHPKFKISSYSINNLYYAETLQKKSKKLLAKKILKMLVALGEGEDSEEKIKELHPDRIPETKDDIETAKEMLRNM